MNASIHCQIYIFPQPVLEVLTSPLSSMLGTRSAMRARILDPKRISLDRIRFSDIFRKFEYFSEFDL